nr:echinoderm microtubule-associated protein-like 4 [Equus asinus]
MEDSLPGLASVCGSSTLMNFCTDDSISAASTSDVQDRLSALELRVQQQEDEITVLKAALADVLRRLAISEDHVASVKKSVPSKGPAVLREAISMSSITNGSGANRKPSHTSSVSIARKETLSSAAKSGTEKKKEKPQGQREKKEDSHSNDQSPQIRASPSPQPSSQPLQIHRQTQESKNSTPTKSIKRQPTAEKSHNSWENSDDSRNKLLRAVSTSKLISKVIKNTDKHKDVIINQAKMSTREKNSQEGEYIKMFMRGRPITMFIPSDVDNYDDIRTELPPEKLKLEWVYGYRGKDCRANVYLLPTGEIVYFIASVVVLFNYEERTQRHYLGHTDCVKCLAIHPDKIRIATGQIAGVDKDGRPLQPHVRVWDSVSLSTLQIIGLGTFERGVGCLDFSKADSGIHLCVIDDSNEHMLTVWDWQKKSKGAEIKTTNEVVLAVEFHPTDANIIITCGKSHVLFWTWSGNSLTRKQGIFGKYEKPKFVQCLAFLGNGDVLTGDSGGVILIWSKTTNRQTYKQIKAHDGSVFTLCQMRNGMLLTGGGKDRKIILWDHDLNPEREIEVPDQYGTIRAVAEGKGDQFLVGTSRNFILRGTFNDGFQIEVQGHTDELWGLATHPFKDLLLTCAQDRQVCMWNSVEHRLEWTRLVDEPGHCADFHPSGTVVAIGTHSGRWFVLDAETRDLVSIHTDGNEQLSVMRYSVDGTLLAVGSHDNFIYLYVVSENGRKYSRYGKCTGHSSYITHLDWSPDNKYIMSNSGDYEILYWDIPSGCKLIRNRSDCKDIDWTTYTCVLGFQVFGVWPEGSDGTDINALVRSHNRKVIAVADDFCKVHLFQYPCSKAKAPSHKYSAHSSHVTNVSFTHSDSHLISTGGKDMSIIQWKLVEKLSLPQNEIAADTTLTKAPISSRESVMPSETPTLPPSQPLNETAEEESRISNSPTLLENSLEQTVEPSEDHSEEQSEGGSEDLGEPVYEEPANAISEEQSEAAVTEDQQDPAPLS